MKLAIVFPGQGSQSPGMGLDLYNQFPQAKKIFDQIDEIAKRPLSQLCFNGPAEDLKRTVNTQPAILSVSIAAWACYREAGGPQPSYVAGHSLGEFSALYAASALSLESTLKLVEKRAQLMEACPPGAMSAVLGMKYDQLNDLCKKVSQESSNQTTVVVANFNTEEQIVISGSPDLVSEVGSLAKSAGAKVIPLSVGGAFHSPFMAEASREFNQQLDQYQFSDTIFPVVQNVTAKAQSGGNAIKETLQKQMTSSVLWYQTIQYMLDQNVTDFIEIGPGKALSGMIKRINKSVQTYNIEDSTSLATTLAGLKASSLR
jgi:[acyl-carrier-protein] S-malonyltransferase